jgi:hypothetical protein
MCAGAERSANSRVVVWWYWKTELLIRVRGGSARITICSGRRMPTLVALSAKDAAPGISLDSRRGRLKVSRTYLPRDQNPSRNIEKKAFVFSLSNRGPPKAGSPCPDT